MNILVLNPGSSSLKYAVYECVIPSREARPEAQRGDGEESPAQARRGSLAPLGMTQHGVIERIGAGDMERATTDALNKLGPQKIDAVGCRVVHGGSKFAEPVLVTEAVIKEIRDLAELAPLHNPLAVSVIESTRKSLDGVPIVAVFDTAFHRTMPRVASHYALPADIPVRRYGFHGISYAYLAGRIETLIGPGKRVIACHLGNGASVCAMRDGASIDTSMGLTPIEGLVMGTRAGDLDPGAILFLLRMGMTEEQLDDLLNHRSGLLGVSGRSADVRELEAAAAGADEKAEEALEMFAYRVGKYIGAYSAAMEGVDAVVFSAGIGEHSASMRTRITGRLSFLGITLDDVANRASSTKERAIHAGPVAVWVIPTNEELEIARATVATIGTT